jgi:hypothetical protein
MAAEFVFRISSETILIDDKKTGYHLELRNSALINRKKGLILALGQPEDVVRKRLGHLYDRQAADVQIVTLFGPDGRDLVYEIRAFEHFTRLLHAQGQEASAMSYFAAKAIKGFDYFLEIPGYESFAEARRHALEQQMQAHLRLRRLVINGKELHIPTKKRELEIWLRRALVRLLPVVAVAAAFLSAPSAMAQNRLALLVYLLAVLFIFYYGGRVLWMLLARRIVPVGYCLAMLRGTRDRLSSLDAWLARAVWGASSAD